MTCKGTCSRYRATKTFGANSRYEAGQKRYKTCDIFISWEGIRCPCCNFVLREKPRAGKHRQKFMENLSNHMQKGNL